MAAVDIKALERIATQVAEGLYYELVDLEWKHESGRWVLRVFIDQANAPVDGKPPTPMEASPQGGVSLDDCSKVSHALSAELDVADAIHVPFTLEVSSPGLDRPLKKEADFRRYAGKKVKLRARHGVPTEGGENRRNFTGQLLGCDGGKVRIDVDGQVFEIPVADVDKANLQFEL